MIGPLSDHWAGTVHQTLLYVTGEQPNTTGGGPVVATYKEGLRDGSQPRMTFHNTGPPLAQPSHLSTLAHPKGRERDHAHKREKKSPRQRTVTGMTAITASEREGTRTITCIWWRSFFSPLTSNTAWLIPNWFPDSVYHRLCMCVHNHWAPGRLAFRLKAAPVKIRILKNKNLVGRSAANSTGHGWIHYVPYTRTYMNMLSI